MLRHVGAVRLERGGVVRFEKTDDLIRLEQDEDDELAADELADNVVRLEDWGAVRLEGFGADDDLVRLEGLDFDDLGAFDPADRFAVAQFEGFWGSITKGFKKATKIVKGVVKAHTAGILPIIKGVAKVGAFISKVPLLKNVITAAAVPFVGPAAPALFEIASSITQQIATARSPAGFIKGLAKEAVKLGSKPSVFLPGANFTGSAVKSIMQQIHKAGPARIRIAQQIVRAGVPANVAAQIVNPSTPTRPTGKRHKRPPTKKQVRQMAALAGLAVQLVSGETRGLPASLRFRA